MNRWSTAILLSTSLGTTAAFTSTSSTTFYRTKTSTRNNSNRNGNADIRTSSYLSSSSFSLLKAYDPNDPYADIAKNYGYKAAKKAASSASSTSTPSLDLNIDTSTLPSSTSIPSSSTPSTSSPEEMVDKVIQAASSAIDASDQASAAAASISGSADKAPTLYEFIEKSSVSGMGDSFMNSVKESAESLKNSPNLGLNTGTTSGAGASTSASTAKATGSAVEYSADKVPTLFEYLKSPSTVTSDLKSTGEKLSSLSNQIVDSPISQSTRKGLVDAGESLNSLKSVNIGSKTEGLKKSLSVGVGVEGGSDALDGLNQVFSSTTDGLTSATKSFTAAVGAVGAAGAGSTAGGASVEPFDLQQFLSPFQFETYGPWYITSLAILTALAQRNAGKNEAREEYEAKLAVAQKRADEAAEAAIVAARGAKLAKELVQGLTLEDVKGLSGAGGSAGASGSGSEDLLEKSRLEQLTIEKELLEGSFTNLVQETNSLRNQVDNLLKSQPGTSSSSTDAAPEIEIPIGKSTMDRDPEEDAKILQVLKDIDEENAKVKVKELEEAVKSAKTKAKTTTKAKATKAKATKAKATKAKASTKKKSPKKKAKKATKAKSVKKAAPKEAKVVVTKDDTPTIEVTKEEVAVPKPKKKAAKKKKTPKAKSVKKAPASAPASAPAASSADDENPWGKLKESTLKRKTIAQLTAYLEERKMYEEGMSKTDMVKTIQGANVSV